MKVHHKAWMIACGLSILLPLRGMAEGYVIVKVQDMLKKTTTEMMTESEYKALEKTIQMENRFFQQAVQIAAKEWRADELNKGTPFAGGRLMARKIVGTPERFSNQEKAQQKLTAIEDLESKKAFRAREKEAGNKKSKEELAKEYEKEAVVSSAAELVQAKLEELISAKSAAPAGGAAPGAKPVDNAAAKEAGLKAL